MDIFVRKSVSLRHHLIFHITQQYIFNLKTIGDLSYDQRARSRSPTANNGPRSG